MPMVEDMAAEQRVFHTYDCFHDRPHVEPYPDISGIGVSDTSCVTEKAG